MSACHCTTVAAARELLEWGDARYAAGYQAGLEVTDAYQCGWVDRGRYERGLHARAVAGVLPSRPPGPPAYAEVEQAAQCIAAGLEANGPDLPPGHCDGCGYPYWPERTEAGMSCCCDGGTS